MKKKVDSQLVADSVLEIFEEMIRNMPPEQQKKARLEFDEIINKELDKRVHRSTLR